MVVGHYMQDYKCMCTAVMIRATVFVPKFVCPFLTPQTSKSRSGICCTRVRYTHDRNLLIAGQQVAEIMQKYLVSIFMMS